MTSEAPPALLVRATRDRIRGRVHFERDRVGDIVAGPDGEFVVFRKMVRTAGPGQPTEPGARFTVRFDFANLSAATNRRLSLIPAPFIAAQPGFRSKTWMLGRATGLFQGVYEFDTVADAEAYWTSFPMRMMKRRAKPGSVTYTVEPLAGA